MWMSHTASSHAFWCDYQTRIHSRNYTRARFQFSLVTPTLHSSKDAVHRLQTPPLWKARDRRQKPAWKTSTFTPRTIPTQEHYRCGPLRVQRDTESRFWWRWWVSATSKKRAGNVVVACHRAVIVKVRDYHMPGGARPAVRSHQLCVEQRGMDGRGSWLNLRTWTNQIKHYVKCNLSVFKSW